MAHTRTYLLSKPRHADEVAMQNWSEQEKAIAKQEEEEKLRSELDEELHPSRKCLHQIFIFISRITTLSAMLMLISQFLGIYFRQEGPIQYVIRIYVMVLCVIVMFNELEFTKMVRESAMLRIWITRGAIYAFIGILGLEEAESSPTTSHKDSAGRDQALTFVMVIAWIMIGLGVLYFVMGVLCLQLVLNRLREEYQERLERSNETQRTSARYGGVMRANDEVV
jgi:multisubunit Na+/H+ antiporter MnhC subunit